MNNTKTRWVITWEDGRTEVIYRKSNGWHWSGGRGYGGGISSHLDNVKHQVKALGGTMVREPNPDYRETEPEPFALLGRVLRGF
jgi:hypothetical protein